MSKKGGFVEVTKEQLMSFKHDIQLSGGSNTLMKLIQEAGGPVSGIIDLRPDMVNYCWNREDFEDTIIFKWKEF